MDAIRLDTPRPTVHSRNLFHLSAAMYDAWSAYDGTSTQYLHHESATAADIGAARDEAISHAAYNILKHRFQTGPGSATSQTAFDDHMELLGYDKTYVSTVGNTPAALGNRIAQTVINYGSADGANEQNDYADTSGYFPVNPAMVKDLPGTDMFQPNRWQPLAFDHLVLQNGIVIGTAVQEFINPNWGDVTPFAMSKASPADIYHDVGPPPQLGDIVGGGDAEFKTNVLEVIRFSSLLDPNAGNMIDISPAVYGNNPLGTKDGTGYGNNPVTGAAYTPNVVNHADYGRAIAEFWADGPHSETPPGHWNVLANDLSDAGVLEKRIGGVGPIVSDLEWDVKMYFAMNGAMHDAAVAAWNHKGAYDYARPISMIRYMGGKGQSSDPLLVDSYDPEGLPLESGLVEVITTDTTMPGGKHEHLAGHEGEIAILAWQGEPADVENEVGGVGWIRAIEWLPYQRSTFVTPAFAAYLSGHSTFSQAGAEILAAMTGSPYFPGGLWEYTIPADHLDFEAGPDTDIVLQWARYADAADEAGVSRLYGGIHVSPDDLPGRELGSIVGIDAYTLSIQYFNGTVIPEPASLMLITIGATAALLRRRD